jgi:hypothetical protein
MPVRVLRTEAPLLHFVAAAFVVLAGITGINGCASPAVGAPCIPEQVPEGGFDINEAYIESSSVQCETRVCMVWHLKGAPPDSPSCTRDKATCALEEDLTNKVYCTCRCQSGNSKFASCSCPSGYSCTPVLEQGSEGVRGSYCVRSSTVNEGSF